MALYRNIAGIPDNRAVGLSILQAPTTTTFTSSAFNPITSSIPISSFPSIADNWAAWQAERDRISAQIAAEKRAKYDWLMSHTYEEITAAGYYVAPDNGSIFQWTDAAHTTSRAWLPLQDFQEIENERGTAGALMLHMMEPALAKDTAGYQGGASGTWYSDNGIADPTTQQVVDPITEVEILPPVTTTGDGTVQFQEPAYGGLPTNGLPTPTTPTTTNPTTTTPPTTSTPLPVDRATALKNNLFPLAVMAGVVAVAIIGEDLPRRKLIVLGGIGTLFYLMAKKQ